MNTDKYTNILAYADKKIVARAQSEKQVASYFFETSDSTSLEMVTFCLAGGAISSTAVVPKENISMNSNIKYFYEDAR